MAASSGNARRVIALPSPETTLAPHSRTYAGERQTPPGDHRVGRVLRSYGASSDWLGPLGGAELGFERIQRRLGGVMAGDGWQSGDVVTGR